MRIGWVAIENAVLLLVLALVVGFVIGFYVGAIHQKGMIASLFEAVNKYRKAVEEVQEGGFQDGSEFSRSIGPEERVRGIHTEGNGDSG